MWTGDTKSSPHRRQKGWKRGEREEKFCLQPPTPGIQLLSPAHFHGSVKVGAVVKPTFYSLTLLISGLVTQPQCHISTGSSGGQKAWKAVSNPLILPCSQGVAAGCAHKPPRRGDNSFPESLLSKDTRHGLAVGCRSTPAVLLHMGCLSPPSHDHLQASVSWECKRQGRGGVYGSQVPSWLCLLACRESLQSLQSSWCRSQFTPPPAPNKLLQKQTGGSNTLSGECSHLMKKGTIFCWISKYQHLEASESTLRSCCVSSLPREVLLLPICPTQSSTASDCAADDGLVINVRSQVITWLWEMGLQKEQQKLWYS